MNEYNTSTEEMALHNIGRQYRIAARILANLGLPAPAQFCLFQALENYMKAIHTQTRTFSSLQEWKKVMKSYSHKLTELYDDLPEDLKNNTKHGFSVPKQDNIRYNGSFGFSRGWFRESEKFLYELGVFIGEMRPKSQFHDWISIIRPNPYTIRGKKMIKAHKMVVCISDKQSNSEKTKRLFTKY